MKWFLRYITDTVGQKQVMAVTGIFLCVFLLIHSLGNTLILMGQEAYDHYSHALIHSPIVWPTRIGLFLFLVFHVFLAIKVSLENNAARGTKYHAGLKRNGKGNIASKTMIWTGIGVVIWVGWHILTFSALPVSEYKWVNFGGVEMRDIHTEVMTFFASPINAGLYVVGSLLAGTHAFHALQSAFQTLGAYHRVFTNGVETVSKAFGLFVFLCFSTFPIFGYLSVTL